MKQTGLVVNVRAGFSPAIYNATWAGPNAV